MDIQLYIKDGIIRDRSRIVIIKGNIQIINPTEEMDFIFPSCSAGAATDR